LRRPERGRHRPEGRRHRPEGGPRRARRPGRRRPPPALEDLSLASDFSAFLKAEVGEALRRQALKKLFADPHFNRMDGLDIYIDDYSVPDPIPPELMDKLEHAREWLSGREGASAPEAEEEPGAPAPPTPSPPAAIAGSASDPDSAPAAAAGSDSPEPRPARRAATGEAAAPARRPVCRTGDEKGRN
jgi:hypothetical protein